MIVKVRLFASFREIANGDYVELKLEEGSTYEGLLKELSSKLGVNQSEIRMLVNDRAVELSERVDSSQKIVAFPPVAGG